MSGYIYIIKNTVNSKLYIGQTIGSLEKRFREHCSTYSQCVAIRNAIQKHGSENFSIESVFESDLFDELNKKEQELIVKYNSLSPNGYNLRLGGNNSAVSEETARKISIANSGENPPMFGKHHSGETVARMSKAAKGRAKSKTHRDNISKGRMGYTVTEETKKKISIGNLGKVKSEETRMKLSEANKGIPRPKTNKWRENQKLKMTGRKHSEETKQKCSESKKKKILCNETGAIYPSIAEAAIAIGRHRDSIRNQMIGKNKTCNGLTFSFLRKNKNEN